MEEQKIKKAVESLRIEKGKARYSDYEYLLSIGKEEPKMLYEYSKEIADALNKEKADILYVALHLSAYIARKDEGNFFKGISKIYFSLLTHESVVVAPHAARLLGHIVKIVPDFEPKITNALLNLCNTHHKNIELTKAYAVTAFAQYYETAGKKDKIIEFAENLLTSKSPKARKNAKDFLSIHFK